MKERFINLRWYFLSALFLIATFVWYAVWREDRHGILTVAFLAVPQGRAVYIEAPNGSQALVDAGPDKKILDLLGKVMPFYDRSIDLLVSTSARQDHLAGLMYVAPRYEVGAFVNAAGRADSYLLKDLQRILFAKRVKNILFHPAALIDMGGGVNLRVGQPMELLYGKTAISLAEVDSPSTASGTVIWRSDGEAVSRP